MTVSMLLDKHCIPRRIGQEEMENLLEAEEEKLLPAAGHNATLQDRPDRQPDVASAAFILQPSGTRPQAHQTPSPATRRIPQTSPVRASTLVVPPSPDAPQAQLDGKSKKLPRLEHVRFEAHEIVVRHLYCRPKQAAFKIDYERTCTTPLILHQTQKNLSITATPQNSEIFANGKPQSETMPLTTTDQPEGAYKARAALSGYAKKKLNVFLAGKPEPSGLRLKSEPVSNTFHHCTTQETHHVHSDSRSATWCACAPRVLNTIPAIQRQIKYKDTCHEERP